MEFSNSIFIINPIQSEALCKSFIKSNKSDVIGSFVHIFMELTCTKSKKLIPNIIIIPIKILFSLHITPQYLGHKKCFSNYLLYDVIFILFIFCCS